MQSQDKESSSFEQDMRKDSSESTDKHWRESKDSILILEGWTTMEAEKRNEIENDIIRTCFPGFLFFPFSFFL